MCMVGAVWHIETDEGYVIEDSTRLGAVDDDFCGRGDVGGDEVEADTGEDVGDVTTTDIVQLSDDLRLDEDRENIIEI